MECGTVPLRHLLVTLHWLLPVHNGRRHKPLTQSYDKHGDNINMLLRMLFISHINTSINTSTEVKEVVWDWMPLTQ